MAKRKNQQQEVVEDQNEGGVATEEFEEDAQRSGPGTPDPESDAQAETETKKSKYKTMIIGLSKAREPIKDELDKLSARLGCKNSDLIWEGIQRVLKDPPAHAPHGATRPVGSSPGFWVVATNDNGQKTVSVQEVASRSDVSEGARMFFRFKEGDDKARTRAKGQALRQAQSDASLLGIDSKSIEVNELS